MFFFLFSSFNFLYLGLSLYFPLIDCFLTSLFLPIHRFTWKHFSNFLKPHRGSWFCRVPNQKEGLARNFKPDGYKIKQVVNTDQPPLSLNNSDYSRIENIVNNSLIQGRSSVILNFQEVNLNTVDNAANENMNNEPDNQVPALANDIIIQNNEDPNRPSIGSLQNRDMNEEENNQDYSRLIIGILGNTLILQIFMILMMIYFLEGMSYIVIVLFFCSLDLGNIIIILPSLKNSM